MTDRELLELSAKAAGIPLYWMQTVGNMAFVETPDGHLTTMWDPLENDGDALRLVAFLRLWIDWSENQVAVISFGHDVVALMDRGGDSRAALRRAIVTAAAMIEEAKHV